MILSEAQQRPAARCVEEIVTYDYSSAKKTTLPAYMVKAFGETFDAQEKAKEDLSKRVMSLMAQVQALERSSWDREGAKEDLGSAVS
jgi:hypothetical protein